MEIFSGKCRKHPTSNQQPGICSACLRDRLLQLADAYNHSTALHAKPAFTADRYSTFSSSSPVYFSNFTDISSDRRRAKHVRNASDVVRSISYVIGGEGELKKSRSIATAVVVRDGGCQHDDARKNRGSFWKKVLRIRENRGSNEMLGKSRTVKDRLDE